MPDKKSFPSEYEALINHPFFHDIERTEQPVGEELKAADFAEMPTLYEVYHDKPEVMIQELAQMFSTETELKGGKPGKERLILIAYNIPKRFVILQDIEVLNCEKFNLLALWKAGSPFSRSIHYNFTEAERLSGTRKGRKVLSHYGFKFDRPKKPR